MSYDRSNEDYEHRVACDARDAHYIPQSKSKGLAQPTLFNLQELQKRKRRVPAKHTPCLPVWLFEESYSTFDYVCTYKPGILHRDAWLTLRGWTVHQKESLMGWTEDKPLEIQLRDMHGSIGARHYYSSVFLPQLLWRREGDKDSHRIYTSATGVFCSRVDCCSRITAAEIAAEPERWRAYKANDFYPGHATPQIALERAQEWIKRFTRGFKVKLCDNEYGLKL